MDHNHLSLLKQRIAHFSIYFASLFIFGNIHAQVTIGSGQKSNAGALLDLKQESDGTSSKGLGLSRVLLKSLKIPEGSVSLHETIENATGIWDKEEHIGLVVYSMNENDICDSYTIKPGPYVWDGDEWRLLSPIELGPGVRQFIDSRDGEKYLYRQFGDAGEWMLENLRYIHPGFTRSYIVKDPEEQIYAYPNPNPGSVSGDDIPETWRPEQGLLYTYAAITLGVQDSIEVNQGFVSEESSVDYEYEDEEGPYPSIKGICPSGWHIPSDKEWSELEEVIYNQAYKYSRYTKEEDFPFKPIEWDKEWSATENQPRGAESSGGHGIAMLSECSPVGSVIPTGGKSLPVSSGGFNILLVGGTGETGVLGSYGISTGYWTSSAFGPEYAWFRLFSVEKGTLHQQVTRGFYQRQSLTALRCKR